MDKRVKQGEEGKEGKGFNTESTEEREHRVHREERGPANREISVPGRLEGVAGLGGFEVLDAVAEEALLGELFGEDDLSGDENGGLAGLIGDGDFDEGLRIIFCAAFEAQAALGHVLALDDVVAALGMADTGRVGDFDARVFAAIDARRGGFFLSGRRDGEDGARFISRLSARGVSTGLRRRRDLRGIMKLSVERRRSRSERNCGSVRRRKGI